MKGKSPSQQVDAIIKEPSDWRGKKLSQLRALIKKAQNAQCDASHAPRNGNFTACMSSVAMKKYRIRAAFTFDNHFKQFGFVTIHKP